jgi:hypothetical protein
LKERAESLFGYFPYRCKDCGHRFLQSRYAGSERRPGASATEREIRTTRASIKWKRTRRELLLYGSGILLFMLFLYYITRERDSAGD